MTLDPALIGDHSGMFREAERRRDHLAQCRFCRFVFERPQPLSDEAIDKIVEVVKIGPPDWKCDRCGMTADGFEPRPFGWQSLYQQPTDMAPDADRWDLCSGCVHEYTRWLDEPARELEEAKARQMRFLRTIRGQFEAAKAEQEARESITHSKAVANTPPLKPRSWFERLKNVAP